MSGSRSIAGSSRSRFDLRTPALIFGVFLAAAWLLPLLPRTVLLQSIAGAGAVAYLVSSLVREKTSPAELGLSITNLLPASGAFLAATALLLAPALARGIEEPIAAEEILRYFPWALFQQFLVVAGFFRSFRENALLAAIVFSLAHAPNLPLMALVLAGETIWLLLFARLRNLFALALAHALAALVVSHTLVPEWLPTLRVGLGFFRR